MLIKIQNVKTNSKKGKKKKNYKPSELYAQHLFFELYVDLPNSENTVIINLQPKIINRNPK